MAEFPDEATFKAFYYSYKYQEILKVRNANAISRAFGIQGV